MTAEHFVQLERVGDEAFRLHDQPDASLWELRTKSRVHTYSTAMCWAGCDRLAKVAQYLGLLERGIFWRQRADTILERIKTDFWNPKLASFVSAAQGTEADASLLQLAELGAVEVDDPRFLGTLKHIEANLLHGFHVFRYAERDDFGVPKTAFNICTFWYIDALYRTGRGEHARAVYDQVLSCRNHVGLLSEDIDVATGELWGNYPQTYSQVGIINSAMRLSKSWRDAL